MLPGSLTLGMTAETRRGTSPWLLCQSARPITLTSHNDKKHSPFRATHNRTDNQCGQDAELTNPVQSKHHPFFLFPPLFTTTTTAATVETAPDALQIRVNPLIAPRGESRLRRGVKVSSSLWMESDMKYGQTSPPRHEHWLRFSLPCLTVPEEEEALTFRSWSAYWWGGCTGMLLLVAVKALGLFKSETKPNTYTL